MYDSSSRTVSSIIPEVYPASKRLKPRLVGNSETGPNGLRTLRFPKGDCRPASGSLSDPLGWVLDVKLE